MTNEREILSDMYDEAYSNGARDALANQWVSVDERLPDDQEIVYVVLEYEGRRTNDTRFIFNGEWHPLSKEDVTHWMPTPPLPDAVK